MIFVTLGSQKFQFNRLLKAIDELVYLGKIKDNVFAQIGYSDYKPQFYQYKQFVDRNEFSYYEGNADIVITHGGTGAIIGAVKKGKKVIAVARKAKYGEHVDDHQIQIIEQFTKMNIICCCEDINKLDEMIEMVKHKNFDCYESNTQKYISSIEKFIEEFI